jgi:hypothetical protein
MPIKGEEKKYPRRWKGKKERGHRQEDEDNEKKQLR